MTNKEAIKTLEANYPDACFEQLREAVDAAIEALKAQDADSDTISRKAAIDAVRELYIQSPKINNDIVYDTAIDQAHDTLVNLPPAQPEQKNGKWINVRHDNIAECDQCGITGRAWMNFCFGCGADMREGAERRTDEPDK